MKPVQIILKELKIIRVKLKKYHQHYQLYYWYRQLFIFILSKKHHLSGEGVQSCEVSRDGFLFLKNLRLLPHLKFISSFIYDLDKRATTK